MKKTPIPIFRADLEIGLRIRELRRQAGWTQAELARRAKMHAVPLSDIERGKHLPSLPVLRRLAEALGRTAAELLEAAESAGRYLSDRNPAGNLVREGQAEYGTEQARGACRIRFPGEPELPLSLIERLDRWVAGYLALEDLCGAQKNANLPLDIRMPVHETELESFAAAVRSLLGIGHGVIFDYLELLENAGLRILFLPLPEAAQSVSCHDPANRNGFLFISTRPNVERQLFRLICELGRIYYQAGGSRMEKGGLDGEHAARKFAAFFLMPAPAVHATVRQLGIRADQWTYELLLRIKHRFGVSAEALLYRLNELRLIEPELVTEHRASLKAHYAKTGNKEPAGTRRILTPNGRFGDLLHVAARLHPKNPELAALRARMKEEGVGTP